MAVLPGQFLRGLTDTIQITRPILPLYFFTYFEESPHEYERRDRTHTGNCDGYTHLAGAKVFKLYRSGLFDRRGHLGADAPRYHHVRST